MLDDPSVLNTSVSPLLGQIVALTVTPDDVAIGAASPEQVQAAAAAAAAANGGSIGGSDDAVGVGDVGSVSRVTSARLLPLLDCMPTLAGAKASACARLEQVRGRVGCARIAVARVPFAVVRCCSSTLAAWPATLSGPRAAHSTLPHSTFVTSALPSPGVPGGQGW